MTIPFHTNFIHKGNGIFVLLSFCFFFNQTHTSFSQGVSKNNFEVDNDVSLPDRSDIPNLKKFILSKDTLSNSKVDTINSIKGKYDHFDEPQLIYNKKDWESVKDSLTAKDLEKLNLPSEPDNLLSTIPNSKDETLHFINDRLSNDENTLLSEFKNINNKIDSSFSYLENASLNNLTSSNVNSELSGFAKDSISTYKEEFPDELPSLPSKKIDSQVLEDIDSIKGKTLSDIDMSFLEKADSSKQKLVELKKIQKLKDKVYFEGVFSFIQGEQLLLQASPAFAYHISPNVSLGIGPSVTFPMRRDSTSILSVGVRSFLKHEFFSKKAYVQLENDLRDVTYDFSNEGRIKLDSHSLLFGAGTLLPLYNKFKINLGLYYQILGEAKNKNMYPFLIRIGISKIK